MGEGARPDDQIEPLARGNVISAMPMAPLPRKDHVGPKAGEHVRVT